MWRSITGSHTALHADHFSAGVVAWYNADQSATSRSRQRASFWTCSIQVSRGAHGECRWLVTGLHAVDRYCDQIVIANLLTCADLVSLLLLLFQQYTAGGNRTKENQSGHIP